MNHQLMELKVKFKRIKSPAEALQLLQQAIDVFNSVDKHLLQDFILYLRQIATDLQFKHYRARCQYIIISPEDSLTFWICLRLGNCPDNSRFAFFEGEVLELLKLLAPAEATINQSNYLPRKEIEAAIKSMKNKYPGFLTSLIREPLLIPVLNFSMQGGSVIDWPQLHCFALLGTKHEEGESLITILHSLVRIIHYTLTEDLKILPLGFANLLQKLSLELDVLTLDDAETFTETMTASLLYGTEYMPLVAYMEFDQRQHMEIHRYFSWLQEMFLSEQGTNVKKLMEEHRKRLRA